MNKLFYLLSCIFLIGFSFACDTGCINPADPTSCYDYGDDEIIGPNRVYCDFDSDSFVNRKTSGSCLNDFECASNFKCLGEVCTAGFNEFIENYNDLLVNSSNLCIDTSWFCSNVSVINAIPLDNICAVGYSCFSCSQGYYYNQTINRCIKGICESNPGCLNVSSLSNSATEEDYYCPNNEKCYDCSSNFRWNNASRACLLKNCSSSPGCLSNTTNLSNADVLNFSCDVGQKCFRCASGRAWNATSSTCVLSSASSGTSGALNYVVFSSSDFEVGTYKGLDVNDAVSFFYADKEYIFVMRGIDGSIGRISFVINYVVFNQNLFNGQSRSFDLDGDGVYDIKVSLLAISNGIANTSLKFVSEKYLIAEEEEIKEVEYVDSQGVPEIIDNTNLPDNEVADLTNSDLDNNDKSFAERNFLVFVVFGIIIIVLIILLIYFLMRPTQPSRNSSQSNPAVIQQRPLVPPANAPFQNMPYKPLPTRPIILPTQQPIPNSQPVQPLPPRRLN